MDDLCLTIFLKIFMKIFILINFLNWKNVTFFHGLLYVRFIKITELLACFVYKLIEIITSYTWKRKTDILNERSLNFLTLFAHLNIWQIIGSILWYEAYSFVLMIEIKLTVMMIYEVIHYAYTHWLTIKCQNALFIKLIKTSSII